MILKRPEAIAELKEIAKNLSMASALEFSSEIDDIQKQIMRIETEGLESVSFDMAVCRLIMSAKQNVFK